MGFFVEVTDEVEFFFSYGGGGWFVRICGRAE